MPNMNFDDMMKMLAKMDKKELEARMNQVSKMLENKSPEDVFKEMNGIHQKNLVKFPLRW